MALPSFAVTSDSDLETAVRDKASYGSNSDELPGSADSGQFQGVMQDAKRHLYMKTNSDEWYSEVAYGQALVALTALKAKEAVENINISSYGIGDENLRFTDANPESSQQIVAWSDELNEALEQSDLDFDGGGKPSFSNTSSYLG